MKHNLNKILHYCSTASAHLIYNLKVIKLKCKLKKLDNYEREQLTNQLRIFLNSKKEAK